MPDQLVVAGRYGNAAEGEIAKALLLAFGVDAMVSIDDCGGVEQDRWIAGVRLLVHARDQEKAKQVLESHPA